jgi:hypothetical protein
VGSGTRAAVSRRSFTFREANYPSISAATRRCVSTSTGLRSNQVALFELDGNEYIGGSCDGKHQMRRCHHRCRPVSRVPYTPRPYHRLRAAIESRRDQVLSQRQGPCVPAIIAGEASCHSQRICLPSSARSVPCELSVIRKPQNLVRVSISLLRSATFTICFPQILREVGSSWDRNARRGLRSRSGRGEPERNQTRLSPFVGWSCAFNVRSMTMTANHDG